MASVAGPKGALPAHGFTGVGLSEGTPCNLRCCWIGAWC